MEFQENFKRSRRGRRKIAKRIRLSVAIALRENAEKEEPELVKEIASGFGVSESSAYAFQREFSDVALSDLQTELRHLQQKQNAPQGIPGARSSSAQADSDHVSQADSTSAYTGPDRRRQDRRHA